MGYYIKRTNITADRDITIIGKRLYCGKNAIPFETAGSAESAMKRQEKQDMELCPDCCIDYEIIKTKER